RAVHPRGTGAAEAEVVDRRRGIVAGGDEDETGMRGGAVQQRLKGGGHVDVEDERTGCGKRRIGDRLERGGADTAGRSTRDVVEVSEIDRAVAGVGEEKDSARGDAAEVGAGTEGADDVVDVEGELGVGDVAGDEAGERTQGELDDAALFGDAALER